MLVHANRWIDKTYHVVHLYETEGRTKERVELASKTWQQIEDWAVVPHRLTPSDRDSSTIGDPRHVPFFHDIIRMAVDIIPSTAILVFTNSDICLVPEAGWVIRDAMKRRTCLFGKRADFPCVDAPKRLRELQNIKMTGADLFAFTVAWWKEYSDRIPDFLVGCEGWDFVVSQIMLETCPNAFLPITIAYHEWHHSFWTQTPHTFTNPGQIYNRGLCEDWARKTGRTRYMLDDYKTNFMFKFCPES